MRCTPLSLALSDNALSLLIVRGCEMKCEDLFVEASERIASCSLAEAMRCCSSAVAGSPLSSLPGFGFVFLVEGDGVRIVTVQKVRSS